MNFLQKSNFLNFFKKAPKIRDNEQATEKFFKNLKKFCRSEINGVEKLEFPIFKATIKRFIQENIIVRKKCLRSFNNRKQFAKLFTRDKNLILIGIIDMFHGGNIGHGKKR